MSRRTLIILLTVVSMIAILVAIVRFDKTLEGPQAPLLELPPPPRLQPSSTAWRALFNGHDLAGWQHLGGGKVSVQDGRLVLEHDAEHRPGYVVSEVTTRDFEARFRCLVQVGDSGIFFRSRRDPRTPSTILGPQVQLNLDPERNLGGIYETQGRGWVARPARPLLEFDDQGAKAWLEGEITVVGERIKVVLNGQTAVDFTDDPAANGFREAGFFALQIHGGGPCRVMFERIEVRALD